MPRYTLFAPTGAPPRAKPAPQPLTLAIADWQVKISADTGNRSDGKGYVLTQVDHSAPLRTHLVKHKGPGSNAASVRGGDSHWVPEVDDEVLVAFQHGDSASHAALFLHPGTISRGSAQIQVDISTGTYRLQIAKAGRAPLSIAVATASDAQISRSMKWRVLC